jgi:hypothetical protein
VPRHGFAPPPKGYFAAPGSTPSFSAGVGVSISSARSPLLGPAGALGSPSALDELPASAPSSVPTKGRRRESIGGQMRRKVSESTAAAAGAGGGLGHGSAFSLASRMNIPARGGPGGMGGGSEAFSTSLGAAGEALSLSSSLSTPGMPHLGRTPSAYGASVPNGGGAAAHIKQERTASHTHFGQECYGPTPGETPLSPPAALLSPGSRGAAPPAYVRRPSAAESTATDDDMSVVGEANAKSAPAQQPTSQQSHQQLHKCESCAKVYRHPSCLVKHRWVSLDRIERPHASLTASCAPGTHGVLEGGIQVPHEQAPAGAAPRGGRHPCRHGLPRALAARGEGALAGQCQCWLCVASCC